MILDRDLTIYGNTTDRRTTRVCKNVSMLNNITFRALKLDRIDGWLDVAPSCTVEAPFLTVIRGSLALEPRAKLNAPKLRVVGRRLSIDEDTFLFAPELSCIGGVFDAKEDASAFAPKLEEVDGHPIKDDRWMTRVRPLYEETARAVRAGMTRVISAPANVMPHGRCAHAGYCVEHEINKRVKMCSTGK